MLKRCFYKLKEVLLDASTWHTVSYSNISCFANLRPKDCVRANSRWILG